MNLCNQREIKELLSRHGFRFSKSMGQNFLIEPWVPRQTAEASGAGAGIGVLEVGPGIGPLTEQLAKLAEKVVSVELDKSLLPVLAETMADYPNVEIVPGDIMKTDIARLCREKLPGLPVVACANLPYNITTPAITAMLQAGCFQGVTVMIQREGLRSLHRSVSVLCRQPASLRCAAVLFLSCPQGGFFGHPHDGAWRPPCGGAGSRSIFPYRSGGLWPAEKNIVKWSVYHAGKRRGKRGPSPGHPCLQFDGEYSR